MAATARSTSLVPVQPVFTDAERLALAGYLAGYRGLTREACTLDLRQFTAWCPTRSLLLFAVRRADIETFARGLEARGRARATVTRRLCTIAGFREVRRRGRTPRALARSARTTTPAGLRVARHRSGPQRARRPAGRRRARPARRARPDLPARTQRAAGVGGNRRGHRVSRARARPPDPGHHPQGRQGRHHPARPPDRPRDRPGVDGDRRACERAAVHRCGRAPAGPARRRPHRTPGHPAPRSQARQPAHPAPRLHHRRWMPASRCATCRKPPPTPTRAPPCATTGPAPASTGTPLTSSLPTSPELHGSRLPRSACRPPGGPGPRHAV